MGDRAKGFYLKLFHEDVCYEEANGRDPIAAPWTCSYYLPWKRKYVLVRQNSSREVICGMDMLVLCGRLLSCCNLCLTICMA